MSLTYVKTLSPSDAAWLCLNRGRTRRTWISRFATVGVYASRGRLRLPGDGELRHPRIGGVGGRLRIRGRHQVSRGLCYRGVGEHPFDVAPAVEHERREHD
jgi:hypothetical protein